MDKAVAEDLEVLVTGQSCHQHPRRRLRGGTLGAPGNHADPLSAAAQLALLHAPLNERIDASPCLTSAGQASLSGDTACVPDRGLLGLAIPALGTRGGLVQTPLNGVG